MVGLEPTKPIEYKVIALPIALHQHTLRRRAPYTITIDYLSRTKAFSAVATLSGLEPELFCVTGRCVNHLHYRAEYMNNRCSKLSTRFEGLVSAWLRPTELFYIYYLEDLSHRRWLITSTVYNLTDLFPPTIDMQSLIHLRRNYWLHISSMFIHLLSTKVSSCSILNIEFYQIL